MGQVNRVPLGFLDLLDIQSLGRNPPLFSDAVSPTVDLTEFYQAQTLSIHTLDFVHAAEGDQSIVRVPEDQTWMLRGLSLSTSQMDASMYEQWNIRVQDLARAPTGGATEFHVMLATEILVGNANPRDYQKTVYFGSPGVAFAPGSVFTAKIMQRDAGAGRTTTLNWLINRMNS